MQESGADKQCMPDEPESLEFDLPTVKINQDITVKINDSSKPSKKQIINQSIRLHLQGNILEAMKYYEYFIYQGYRDHRVFSNYAIILKNLGKLKKAELLQRKAIELKPNFAEAHNNLGNILKDLGKLTEAELSQRKAIQLKPNFVQAHSNLGNILRDLGKLEEAEISHRKAINLQPNYAKAHYNLGNTLRDLGKLKEAEISHRKAIKLQPNYAKAHSNLANILKDLGKLNEAEISLRKAIDLSPNEPKSYYNLGNILRDLGKLKEAELSQRKAIELQPNFADAYANLGLLLRGLGKSREAELFQRKAIQLQPNFAEAYHNLANILKDFGNLKEAELSQRKAIEIKPDFAEAHSNLGIILIESGKFKEAELSQRKAIELQPDLAKAHLNLSICLYIMGDNELALDSILKANSLIPKERTDSNTQILLNIIKREQNHKSKESSASQINRNLHKHSLANLPFTLQWTVDNDLIDCLYNIKSRDQGIYQVPTFGNAHGSDYNLFDSDYPIIQRTKKDLIKIASAHVKSDIFICDSFFTIFRSGGGLVSHHHLTKLDQINGLDLVNRKFSLVYYLSIGDQNCDDPGILKLENPDQNILPDNGLIVIFPAARKHSVFYNGKKDRIIIGVNFYSI